MEVVVVVVGNNNNTGAGNYVEFPQEFKSNACEASNKLVTQSHFFMQLMFNEKQKTKLRNIIFSGAVGA